MLAPHQVILELQHLEVAARRQQLEMNQSLKVSTCQPCPKLPTNRQLSLKLQYLLLMQQKQEVVVDPQWETPVYRKQLEVPAHQ
jgi:hypothetical protein